jgi:hypothetical protein
VEGVPVVAGSTLTAKTTPSRATVTCQWQRADAGDGNFRDITDATSKTYRLVEEDKGQYIRVIVEGYGSYRGTKTSAAVGPVGTPDKSIYKLSHTGLAESYVVVDELIEVEGKETSEINSAVAAGIEDLEPVKVTLAVDIKGGAGYEHVRIAPIEAGENIQFWAKDTSNNWYDINVAGWGPSSGFELSADSYDVTTDIYILSNEIGTYELNVKLVDVSDNNALIAKVSGTVTVRNPEVSEYGFVLTSTDQEFIAGDLLEGSVIEGENGVDTTDLTPVGVTLKATTINELGYDNVKVLAPEVTGGEGTLQFWAYSADDGKWFDAAVHGWGSGFAITPDYDITTDVYVFADTAGTYTVTFKLVDLDNEDTEIATETVTITVISQEEAAKAAFLAAATSYEPESDIYTYSFDGDNLTIDFNFASCDSGGEIIAVQEAAGAFLNAVFGPDLGNAEKIVINMAEQEITIGTDFSTREVVNLAGAVFKVDAEKNLTELMAAVANFLGTGEGTPTPKVTAGFTMTVTIGKDDDAVTFTLEGLTATFTNTTDMTVN